MDVDMDSMVPVAGPSNSLALLRSDNGGQLGEEDSEMQVEAELAGLETQPAQHGGLDDDEDDPNTSPSLYLRKFWRQVSPEPPSFQCLWNPRIKAFTCTLVLHIPPEETRTFRSPPVYPTKRAAIRAMASYAITCGVLAEGYRAVGSAESFSLSAMSQEGLSLAIDDLSNNARLDDPKSLTSVRNPVTLLNLAVQKYCVEPPNVVLDFNHDTVQTPERRGYVHKCSLRVRLSPETLETYATSEACISTRIAKERVSQIALEEGVIILFKLHNSMTTKICRLMGTPVPSNIRDHDTEEEENTAGKLAQFLQQLTRRQDSMSVEYKQGQGEAVELYGADLVINLTSSLNKRYTVPPLFRSRRDAKECVCRLAVKTGIYKDFESMWHSSPLATAEGLQFGSTSCNGPRSEISSSSTANDDPISELNATIQRLYGQTVSVTYTFGEATMAINPQIRMGPRFSCTLEVRLPSSKHPSYHVEPIYESKKAAKNAVARLALSSGILSSTVVTDAPKAAADSFQHPLLDRASAAQQLSFAHSREPVAATIATAEPSETVHNSRVRGLGSSRAQVDDSSALPPPPYARYANPPPHVNGHPGINATSEPAHELPLTTYTAADGQRWRVGTSTNQLPAGQPHLEMLKTRFVERFGASGPGRIKFELSKDCSTDLYGGRLVLAIDDNDNPVFACTARMSSPYLAEEALATEATNAGVLHRLKSATACTPVVEGQTRSSEEHNFVVAGGPGPALTSWHGCHPVSYLHQMCQILLGTEAHQRPVFDLVNSSGKAYSATLKIPSNPPRVYSSAAEHASKAAAREAIALVALQDGLVEFLKERKVAESGLRVPSAGEKAAATSASTSTSAQPALQINGPGQVSERAEKGSYEAKLKVTMRESPTFMGTAGEGQWDAIRLGDQMFQMSEYAGKGNQLEKLCKKVLRHLVKQDELAGAMKTTNETM